MCVGNTAIYPVLSALVASCAMLSCASFPGSGRPVSYGETARANYDKGMVELEDENYPDALRYFQFVKNKFPFSRYSTLAELRAADVLFAQEKYAAAVDAFKLFINFHPTHPQVLDGYAGYRVCESYVKQIPTDWFLIPPSHEKDQSSARDALRDLVMFERTYTKSKYLSRVRDLHRKTLRRLVDHELYVARFYLDQDKPKATILRLEGVLARFPDAGVDPEVLLMLGQTYLKLDDRDRARQTFGTLIRKYPQGPNSEKAKVYLGYLNRQ